MHPKSPGEIQIGFKDPLVVDTRLLFSPAPTSIFLPSSTEGCKWNNSQVLKDEAKDVPIAVDRSLVGVVLLPPSLLLRASFLVFSNAWTHLTHPFTHPSNNIPPKVCLAAAFLFLDILVIPYLTTFLSSCCQSLNVGLPRRMESR